MTDTIDKAKIIAREHIHATEERYREWYNLSREESYILAQAYLSLLRENEEQIKINDLIELSRIEAVKKVASQREMLNEASEKFVKEEPCICDSHHQYTCERCKWLQRYSEIDTEKRGGGDERNMSKMQ